MRQNPLSEHSVTSSLMPRGLLSPHRATKPPFIIHLFVSSPSPKGKSCLCSPDFIYFPLWREMAICSPNINQVSLETSAQRDPSVAAGEFTARHPPAIASCQALAQLARVSGKLHRGVEMRFHCFVTKASRKLEIGWKRSAQLMYCLLLTRR